MKKNDPKGSLRDRKKGTIEARVRKLEDDWRASAVTRGGYAVVRIKILKVMRWRGEIAGENRTRPELAGRATPGLGAPQKKFGRSLRSMHKRAYRPARSSRSPSRCSGNSFSYTSRLLYMWIADANPIR